MRTQDRHDAGLHLPLEGVHSIEASAGTGKTFTLATLVLRLLVEGRMDIGGILAVTYTEAATEELRARIRARLLLALAQLDSGGTAPADPEAAVTRAILDRWLDREGESREALRRRLHEAASGIDLAAIFTIHGFCARVLREYALECGQAFDTLEILADDRELLEEVAADLWRVHAARDEEIDDLMALWPRGPKGLAKDLRELVRPLPLLPAPGGPPRDPGPKLVETGRALMAAVTMHGKAFREALLEAREAGVLNKNGVNARWVDPLFARLEDWVARGDPSRPPDDENLQRLQPEWLAARTNKGRTCPDSPLCAAVKAYCQALEEARKACLERQAILLHRLRGEARQRLALRKRQLRVQTYDDLIDRVADALAGPSAQTLVRRLRQQYRAALVDEFQDTDPRQWQIFRRVFGTASTQPALFLIGDPKQAIYGFRGGDVDTYLAAVKESVPAPPLDENFRSRPRVLQAVEALYAAAGDHAFVLEGIRFHPVRPGGVRLDADFLIDGKAAPGLTLWQAPPPEGTCWTAEASRALATGACVARIHQLLCMAREGRVLVEGKRLEPGHIAVLVRSNGEATRIRRALAEAGIPAVATARQSLFATDEAREVLALLLALLHGADDGRLRAALATVLVGVDAAALAALENEPDGMHTARMRALQWRERLREGGVLALVGDLCAGQGPRLARLLDGERRLSNYLQLAEILQERQRRTLGLAGLVDWLAHAIAHADDKDDAQLMRLESDAHRVKIMTLHKSKGLQFPLVFLPYAGIGSGRRSGNSFVTGAGGQRTLHWNQPDAHAGWEEAISDWERQEEGEEARLLYVGLTRAVHAVWVATGAFRGFGKTALARMLATPDRLAEEHRDCIELVVGGVPSALPPLAPEGVPAVAPPRQPQRRLETDWWVHSFTQLSHSPTGEAEAAVVEEPRAADEPALPPDAEAQPPGSIARALAGARFGNAMHAALEDVDFAAWSAWREGQPPPAGQEDVLRKALRDEGYAAEELQEGMTLLARLVGYTLTSPMPEGGALVTLPPDARRAEIEFHFALRGASVPALLSLLHAHGIARDRQRFGLRQRLEGLMTGRIDLTYLRDGRWYVLDFKSNRLPRYDAEGLAEAMAHGEYDLQALLYTVALHRWLRFRFGDAYDYASDFGGIRYLFCRGMDGRGAGIYATRFEPALVRALDALFDGDDAAAVRREARA